VNFQTAGILPGEKFVGAKDQATAN
jgi:hypothetical protein